MSSTVQAESPSQLHSAKPTLKAKKGRQRRGRGVKSAKSEHLSPISKYLVKNKDETETAEAADSAPGSSQHTGPSPEPSQDKATTVTTHRAETSDTDVPSTSKPLKAVEERKEAIMRETRVGVVKKEKRGESDNRASVRGGTTGQEASKRSRTRQRGRRVAHTQDEDCAPVRRQVQKSIRDHFPVRRSGRKSKSEIEKEAFEQTAQRLRDKDESGLKVVDVEGKGRGVISTRQFSREELVCEYSGELISYEEAKRREEEYGRDASIGCYMYYFSYKTSKLCVDATTDNGRKGRLLNHSRTSANVVTKLLEVDDRPYLCLIAARDIAVGEELEYDYGERNREALDSHPWLTT